MLIIFKGCANRQTAASTLPDNVASSGEPPPEVGERETAHNEAGADARPLDRMRSQEQARSELQRGAGKVLALFKRVTNHFALKECENAGPPLPSPRFFSIHVFVRNKLCSLFSASPLVGQMYNLKINTLIMEMCVLVTLDMRSAAWRILLVTTVN